MKNTRSNELTAKLDKLYQDGKFVEVHKYLLENKSAFRTGQFHYNLGTVQIQLKDYGAARYNLEKAINNDFINSKVINNLSTVKKIINVSDISNSSHWQDQFLSWSLNMPAAGYYTITLLLIITFLAFIKKKIIKKALPMGLSLLIAMAPIIYSHFYLENVSFAIAIKNTPLREGPSNIYPVAFEIKEGSKFIVKEFYNGWFYVKRPQYLVGWVKKNDVALY
ncbi:MAG: SH3 domain-containing protein [Bacteriovoracaceae bacterium]|nr:SH3 domain-containing protein [Bacteriovoracaceae bacterium]